MGERRDESLLDRMNTRLKFYHAGGVSFDRAPLMMRHSVCIGKLRRRA